MSTDRPPDPEYVAYLAMRAAAAPPVPPEQDPAASLCQGAPRPAALASLQERLRSPRYWVADRLAGALHRIPVVWPLVSRATDRLIARRQRRRGVR